MIVNVWILGWKASLTSMGDCFYKSIGHSLFGVFCFHIKEAQSQALKSDHSLWHAKLTLLPPPAFHAVMENFISILTLYLATVSHSFSFSPKLPELSGEPTSVNSSRGEWGRRYGLISWERAVKRKKSPQRCPALYLSHVFHGLSNIRVKVSPVWSWLTKKGALSQSAYFSSMYKIKHQKNN